MSTQTRQVKLEEKRMDASKLCVRPDRPARTNFLTYPRYTHQALVSCPRAPMPPVTNADKRTRADSTFGTDFRQDNPDKVIIFEFVI